MDALIATAARALAAGDPLAALKRVALRGDPPALALRGIAMAQLGDLARARALLRRAARAFGPQEPLARARCVLAEAEVALASRELGWPARALDEARATLVEHGDRTNAAYARYLQVRRLRLIASGEERLILLHEVEALLASSAFVVDACRLIVRHEGTVISLARRPVVFALARELGEAWPGDVPRDVLVARASDRSARMNPIARACASRSGGCAWYCGGWLA